MWSASVLQCRHSPCSYQLHWNKKSHVEGIPNCIHGASFLDNEGLCCNLPEKFKKKKKPTLILFSLTLEWLWRNRKDISRTFFHSWGLPMSRGQILGVPAVCWRQAWAGIDSSPRYRQPQGYTISCCGLDLLGRFIVSPKAVSGAAAVFVTLKAGGVGVWFHSAPCYWNRRS